MWAHGSTVVTGLRGGHETIHAEERPVTTSPCTSRRSWPPMALAVLALVAGLMLAPGTVPTASAAGTSQIKGAGSGRCLDVVAASRASGARLNLYDCDGRVNQTWTLNARGQLSVYDPALCLDGIGQDDGSGLRVQVYTCNTGDNQRWTLGSDGTIRNVESGLCLDVKARGTANGSPVSLYTCNGGSNQRWATSLSPSSDTTPPTIPGSPRTADLTCRTVTFSWNASGDDTGVAFYDVYHDGQLIKTVSGSTLSTSVDVVPGVQWGLYVNARDAAGNVSQASATVPIAVPQCSLDTTAPTAPTALKAAASGTSVSLTWGASSDDQKLRAYDLYRDGAKITSVSTTSATPPGTAFTDSGLAVSTTYRYRVVARDAQGNVSPASNEASATTGTGCSNPVCGVRQVATDDDVLWGLVTLPDGNLLYARRDAQEIVRLDPRTGTKTVVGKVPNVAGTDGEGGLMGLEISKDFASDRWLYIMHTTSTDNRVVRMKLNDRLDTASEQVLLKGILRNKFHDGGRLRFGPDGKLYISTGDAQSENTTPQNTNSLNGKVLRINPNGTIPADNPFGNAVWSYGHRNPQGLAFDSRGRLWEQEFGNGIMDDTNLITKGGNYGWPACEGTSGDCDKPGYIAPKRTYRTGDGSCSGIAIVRDALYVACLRGARMYRANISGDSLTNVQQYFDGTYGRLRTVEPSADGGLWLMTSNGPTPDNPGDKDSIPNNSKNVILHVDLGQ